MAALQRRCVAGAADLRFFLHQEGRLSHGKTHLLAATSTLFSTVKCYKRKILQNIQSALFTLLLLTSIALPLQIYLPGAPHTGHLNLGN